MSIEYPTGISTKAFSGRFIVVGLEEYITIVLPTSLADAVKSSVFIITVPVLLILGSISNLSSIEFQSIPFPARSGYPPVAPEIAPVSSVST